MGIGSSYLIPAVHNLYINHFIQKVIGDNKPNGSNTRAISDSTKRLVWATEELWVLYAKVSVRGFHFRSRIFIDGSRISSNKTKWPWHGLIRKQPIIFDYYCWPTIEVQTEHENNDEVTRLDIREPRLRYLSRLIHHWQKYHSEN